jgi:hypothetical protein
MANDDGMIDLRFFNGNLITLSVSRGIAASAASKTQIAPWARPHLRMQA